MKTKSGPVVTAIAGVRIPSAEYFKKTFEKLSKTKDMHYLFSAEKHTSEGIKARELRGPRSQGGAGAVVCSSRGLTALAARCDGQGLAAGGPGGSENFEKTLKKL